MVLFCQSDNKSTPIVLKCTLNQNELASCSSITSTTPVAQTTFFKQSTSTSGRYRLSLNKRVRDKLTKKKLNFIPTTMTDETNESTNNEFSSEVACEIIDNITNNTATTNINSQINMNAITSNIPKVPSCTIDEVQSEINTLQAKIATIKNRNNESMQLTALIEQWKKACHTALQMLQSKLDPPQEIESILKHLNIPIDLIKL